MAKNRDNRTEQKQDTSHDAPVGAVDLSDLIEPTTQTAATVPPETTIPPVAKVPPAEESGPMVEYRTDPLIIWTADYAIRQIEPVMVKMVLRKCAEDMGIESAQRLAHRIAEVRPNYAGLASIGIKQVAARFRAIRAEKERQRQLMDEKAADQPPSERNGNGLPSSNLKAETVAA